MTSGKDLEELGKLCLEAFMCTNERFQKEQEISTLPDHIKLCKYYFAKRIFYIISWSFGIEEIDRIKYLVKIPKTKRWVADVKAT